MELDKLYENLLNHFGPQKWWPAKTEFEVIVGAVLTQRTSWKNVELAIKNLKAENLLSPEKITGINTSKLEKLIRPSGFYKQKAQRLKAISHFILKNKSIEKLAKRETEELRKELQTIKGIGNETADSILLYALNKPVFVVDAYTQRIFERMGIIDKQLSYTELQRFIEEKTDKDIDKFKEFHALIVLLGKNYCKTNPLCENCPIKCEYTKS